MLTLFPVPILHPHVIQLLSYKLN